NYSKRNLITDFTGQKKAKFDERLDRLDSYLKMVTLAGRPFKILNDEDLVELTKYEN
ncbi:MAG: hypothetical protein MHPSP_004932, partial [Paramarteilia canceri]